MRTWQLLIDRARRRTGAERWLTPLPLILVASCAGGGGGGSSGSSGPQPQSIAFAQPGPLYKFAGDAAYADLAAGGGGNGAITYTSDTPAVATVDSASGQVTIIALGTAQITATKAADPNYLSANATYALRVAPRTLSVTGWVGPTDTQLDLAPLPFALDIAHSTDFGCDPANVLTCANGSQSQTTATTLVDATTYQTQSSMYWLKHGPNVAAGIAVPEHRFGDTDLVGTVSGNGRLWALTSGAQGNDVWSSADGANWSLEARNVVGSQQLDIHLLYSNSALWIITSEGRPNQVWRSSDGKTWSLLAAPNFPQRSYFSATAFNGRLWILGGTDGSQFGNDLWSSADGVAWVNNTSAVFPFGRQQSSLVGFNGRLWAIGGYLNGTTYSDVWSSPDGATWTQETASAAFPSRYAAQVVTDGTTLMLFGGNGYLGMQIVDVWSSTDGRNWTLVSTPQVTSMGSFFQAAWFDGAYWIFGGIYSEVWRSVSGASWAPASVDARIPDFMGVSAAGYQGKLWVVGLHAQLFSSTDGLGWTTVADPLPLATADYASIIGLADRLLLVATANAGLPAAHLEAWQSTDGSSWTQLASSLPFSSAGPLQLRLLAGRIWAFTVNGGNGVTPEIWSSADGATWTLATSSAAFAPLTGYQVVAYTGKLFLVGGNRQGGLTNEVWSSTDGVAWTQLPAVSALPAQVFSASFALNDKLCVSAAAGALGPNDLWCSADGSVWNLATSTAPVGVFAQINGSTYGIGYGAYPYVARSLVWRTQDGVLWRLGYQNVFRFP
jgi:hypothetical protein